MEQVENVIGQQRNRLAALGIDVWIPRAVACQKNTAPALWRDQQHAEMIAQPIQIDFQPPASDTTGVEKIERVAPPVTTPVLEAESLPPQVIDASTKVSKPERESSNLAIQSLELQLYMLGHCAILLESSQLTDAQQQLWKNIQKAKSGQYAELKWPFPLADFQESRGLSCYIQGFLDANANNKKILCLGKLDFIHHDNILYLASLQDMLAEPKLKKRLWQLMQ